MWGIARSGVASGITIDWFRHGLELMAPKDYLSFRYFEKWCANYFMLLIDNGEFDLKEVLEGRAATPRDPKPPLDLAAILERNRAANVSFAVATDVPPAFRPGDRVGAIEHGHAGHIRLPRYARGRKGAVIAHHGAHALPDEGARGRTACEHLYTVVFSARELWGEDADPRDEVTLDLWERYLVPA
jgi:nitrile hydratase